ncbi:putative Mn2+ efflux pump MntP [Lachnotalea glycerini]|uniref:Putative manganese efflux pump MntP n=1 Tax=Lachnotalea glycerini TaxID=1763509 RepID=A0A255ID22_9FIRM|nr:manganese efflux pump MntP family protein [Lachnotalea glycerini]PXV96138.1 putative Mn2+ efflux pump MntP [Lachnotalea glycerini]RDY31286.1 manganese efflux pump [Lachnotalea glycerini]
MSLIELFVLAVGLSMDAFAVAICKGLAMKKISFKKALTVGLYFGIFQAVMPLAGYLLGIRFQSKITAIDHWITFVLLGIIGANMVKEAMNQESEEADDSLCFKNMFVLAIATSIDALAVGVTFAFLQVDIVSAVSFIGLVTFTLSVIGVKIGNVFGTKYKAKAELTGGIILILMGFKILFEHLGILG